MLLSPNVGNVKTIDFSSNLFLSSSSLFIKKPTLLNRKHCILSIEPISSDFLDAFFLSSEGEEHSVARKVIQY